MNFGAKIAPFHSPCAKAEPFFKHLLSFFMNPQNTDAFFCFQMTETPLLWLSYNPCDFSYLFCTVFYCNLFYIGFMEILFCHIKCFIQKRGKSLLFLFQFERTFQGYNSVKHKCIFFRILCIHTKITVSHKLIFLSCLCPFNGRLYIAVFYNLQ